MNIDEYSRGFSGFFLRKPETLHDLGLQGLDGTEVNLAGKRKCFTTATVESVFFGVIILKIHL